MYMQTYRLLRNCLRNIKLKQTAYKQQVTNKLLIYKTYLVYNPVIISKGVIARCYSFINTICLSSWNNY